MATREAVGWLIATCKVYDWHQINYYCPDISYQQEENNVEIKATFNASFTDIFGVTHPEAVCMVSAVYSSASAEYDNSGNQTHNAKSLSYRVRYWHSAEAMAAQAWPQEFLDKGGSNSFSVDGAAEMGDAAVERCKQHFLTSVLTQANAAA